MTHFHLLEVKKVKTETPDCVSVTFNVPPELKDIFQFSQGQNLTIKKTLNDQELRRNYSICSSPFDNELKVAIKKTEGGVFSTWANESLRPGDQLEVMPPSGKFYTPLHAEHKKSYVAFAAGSGITPVLSIIKTTLLTEPQSRFTLVYGNRTKASILFKEELEALKDKFLNRLSVYHVLSREKSEVQINTGRIDTEKLNLFFTKLIDVKKVDEFFVCGPSEMIFAVNDALEQRGIAKSRIHFELFTVPGQKQSTTGGQQQAVQEDAGLLSAINVKLDGITFQFNLPYNGESILDAALKEGADLPYACKGGVCTTCKAKLTQGEVMMDVNWGLEADEIAQGFILTCQAHPKTEKVTVDFDVK